MALYKADRERGAYKQAAVLSSLQLSRDCRARRWFFRSTGPKQLLRFWSVSNLYGNILQPCRMRRLTGCASVQGLTCALIGQFDWIGAKPIVAAATSPTMEGASCTREQASTAQSHSEVGMCVLST